jgi:tetratricopeptide (TPR) repeat protein
MGDLDRARRYQREALAFFEATSLASGQADTLAGLGWCAYDAGDASEAEQLFRRSLAAARSTGDPRAVAAALEGLAGAAVLVGDGKAAASCLGAADAFRGGTSRVGGDVDGVLAAARALAGDDFDPAFQDAAADPQLVVTA